MSVTNIDLSDIKGTAPMAWDTEFFGCPVAKISAPSLNGEQLREKLEKLEEKGVKLVYWATDSNDEEAQEAANECDGLLVDEKVYYLRENPPGQNALSEARFLEYLHSGMGDGGGFKMTVYPKAEPSDFLKLLAVMAAHVSRFKVDPLMPEGSAEGVFSRMIYNLCMRKNPWVRIGVVTVEEHNYDPFAEVAGFVALSPSGVVRMGTCPLLAINPRFRNNRLGSRLSSWLTSTSNEVGFSHTWAITQRANKFACKLYERMGMWTEKVENYYHFHLGDMPPLPERSRSTVTLPKF